MKKILLSFAAVIALIHAQNTTSPAVPAPITEASGADIILTNSTSEPVPENGTVADGSEVLVANSTAPVEGESEPVNGTQPDSTVAPPPVEGNATSVGETQSTEEVNETEPAEADETSADETQVTDDADAAQPDESNNAQSAESDGTAAEETQADDDANATESNDDAQPVLVSETPSTNDTQPAPINDTQPTPSNDTQPETDAQSVGDDADYVSDSQSQASAEVIENGPPIPIALIIPVPALETAPEASAYPTNDYVSDNYVSDNNNDNNYEPSEDDGQDYDDRSCIIDFYANNVRVYREVLDSGDSQANRRSFTDKANNNIDEIKYSGFCYCWSLLYASQDYGGHSIGLWTDYSDGAGDDSGSYNLSHFLSYSQSTKLYTRWDEYASSYSVYCYF